MSEGVRALTSEALLEAWERGRRLPEPDRSLSLCAAGCPDRALEELEATPIGRRDRLLRAIRVATFGPRAPCFLTCPECGEELEMELDLGLLDAPRQPLDGPFSLTTDDGVELRFRLPDTADLRAAAAVGTPEHARATLLARCVLRAVNRDRDLDPARLPDDVSAALSAEMERLDPDADVQLDVGCPACGARWSSPFDIASFLWRELDVSARRLLREIDVIARSYGWSEADILRLRPTRRQAYLELLGWD